MERNRHFLVNLSIGAVFLLCMPASADEADSCQERRSIEPQLYEMMFDSETTANVQFISGVPLIAPVDGSSEQAQYLTILTLYAKTLAWERLLPQMAQIIEHKFEIAPFSSLGARERSDLAARVFDVVFGSVHEEHEEEGDTIGSSGSPASSHQGHVHLHKRGPQVGFAMSKTVETLGARETKVADRRIAARRLDPQLVREILGTQGVTWDLQIRETRPREFCVRLLDQSTPFVLHESTRNWLVYGYAVHPSGRFWLAYDLSAIEIRVEVPGSSGTISLSTFRQEGQSLRQRNPKLATRFGDYRSYFSSKNLEAFCLLPQTEECLVTAISPVSLDERAATQVLDEQMKKTASGEPRKLRTEGSER